MPTGWCPFVEHIPVKPFSPGGENKVGICDHTAAGFYSTLRNPIFWNNAGYSVHFAVARNGLACQLVSIFDRAYGQGKDANGNGVGPGSPGITWPPFNTMGRRNPNEYLISKEHEDWEIVNGIARPVPGQFWTPAQLEMSLRIDEWCREEVMRVKGVDLFKFGIDSYAGHYMFDPVNRAGCPGSLWKTEYRYTKYSKIFNPKPDPEPEPVQNEEGGDDVAVAIKEPGSIRDYLVRGRRLEFIPSPTVYNDMAAIYGWGQQAEEVSDETFAWLVKMHIESGGTWPGGGWQR